MSEPFYHISPSNVISGNDIEILVILEDNDKIISGTLFFRQVDEISYQEVDMEFKNGSWVGFIPGERVRGPLIEYLVIFQNLNGGQVGVPLAIDPFTSPLNFSVSMRASNLKNQKIAKTSSSDYIDADILILAPEPGSLNRPDEVVISLSLFNAPIVDQDKYILYLDGADVTKNSLIDGEVLSFIPESDLEIGLHNIRVLFKSTYGLDITPVEWAFNVSKGTANMAESFQYNGYFNGKNSRNTASRNVVSEIVYNGKFEGEFKLNTPDGWKIEKDCVSLSLSGKGETKNIEFQIKPTTESKDGILSVSIISDDKTIPKKGMSIFDIEYDHIPDNQ